MEPLKKLVSHSVKGNIAQSVDASMAVEAAEKVILEIFGEALGPHLKPLYVKNRTLTVSCTSTTVAQELKLQEQKILQKLNKALGKKQVDRIRYFA